MTTQEFMEVIRIADERKSLSRTSSGVGKFQKEVEKVSLRQILNVCGCNNFHVEEAMRRLPNGENIRNSMEESIRKAIAKEVMFVKLCIDRHLADENRKLAEFQTSCVSTNKDEFKEVEV